MLYILFEHAVGYCLFKVPQFEEVGALIPQVEAAVTDRTKFANVVKLVAFKAFKNAASSLENMNAISEGILTKDLSAFLQTNMPITDKKNITLGVCDPKLGSAINEALQIPSTHTGVVPEVLRGIRHHLPYFIDVLNAASVKQSELGLGHSYSRGKVKFNVNRVDNMIIQSIALIDQMDKDVNTFSMRIKEWYSYHFPELAKVVTDNYQYALCANAIKNRNDLNEDMLETLEGITKDSAKAQAILDAGRMSMGMDISPIDLLNIEIFAKKVANLAEYRNRMHEYLRNKMHAVAPNMAALMGDIVGARLISHAGSLTNLAKYPASTVQILGAEKALFRALKTKSNTPKYGLIFHSTFIGRAATANKGRISRYLANKCSIASRIDCFADVQTSLFGEKLRSQVEERLKFYEAGELPRKNVDVMTEAVDEYTKVVKKHEKSEKKKKRKLEAEEGEMNGSLVENGGDEAEMESPKKKKKKSKAVIEEPVEEMDTSQLETETPKKKKKKNKKANMSMEANGDAATDMSMNASANASMLEEGGSVKKKNKKAKNMSMNANGDVSADASMIEDGGSVKKKKKKNKLQQ